MKLYCVAITDQTPPQMVTVSDCDQYADKIADYLKQMVPAQAANIAVVPVAEFFPKGYVNCDRHWSDLVLNRPT
jgi:hypothetical protein